MRGVMVLVVVLVGALLPAVGGAQESTDGVGRAAGPGRVETAVAVSAAGWDAADTVVLATAGAFADALAAGSLAAELDAPLLLTPPEGLPAVVLAEIDRLGATRAVLLGGTSAISQAVADQLIAAVVTPRRLSGADRFATAAAVAAEAGIADELLVALGAHAEPDRAWPDALSAGAFVATAGRPPLLLVTPDGVPAATREALEAGDVARVRVMGGAAAVPDAVLAELEGLAGTVQRLSGDSRYATSVAVATQVLDQLHPDAAIPVVAASGANFPDGLAAAALAARQGGLLVLVPPRRLLDAPAMIEFLAANRGRFSGATVIGGGAAVSDAALTDLADVLAGRPLAADGPPGTPTFGDPNPLAVDPELDVERAAAVTVTPGLGGSVSTTGADGTTYTLAVPADAVVLAKTIILTPLRGLSGDLFAADPLAGVDIQPHGLKLLEHATLTVDPAGAVPPREVSTWAYLGDGEDFHLHPADVTDTSVTFTLLHFSGYGATTTTENERQAQAERIPTDTAARLVQMAADALQKVRDGTMTGEQASDRLHQLLIAYYDLIVHQALQQGLSSDGAGERAIGLFFGWMRQAELLGVHGSPEMQMREAEGIELVRQIIINSFDRAYHACVDEHDVMFGLETMVARLREATLLGFEDQIPDAEARMNQCGIFELDLSGNTHERFDPDGNHTFTFSAQFRSTGLRLEFDRSDGIFRGSALLDLVSTSFQDLSGEGCSYALRNAVSGALHVALTIQPDSLSNPGIVLPGVILITPFQSAGTYVSVDGHCEETGSFVFDFLGVVAAAGGTAATGCHRPCDPLLPFVAGWDFDSEGVARKVLSHTDTGGFGGVVEYSGSLEWTLRHAPGP